ncbi:MAG: hypothetical protein ACTSX9_03710 [Candidatus Njordarchaeales archaeon]
MVSGEKILGVVFMLVSIIVTALYIIWGLLAPIFNKINLTEWSSLWGIPVPPLYWILLIPILLLVILGGVIFTWIGWALVQTPSPEEINVEEIEKQLEELEKEEEEKAEKKEEEKAEEEKKEEKSEE